MKTTLLILIKILSSFLFITSPYFIYYLLVDIIETGAQGDYLISILFLTTIGVWISIYLMQKLLSDLILNK